MARKSSGSSDFRKEIRHRGENSGGEGFKDRGWIVMDLQEFEILRKNIFGKRLNGEDFGRGSFLFLMKFYGFEKLGIFIYFEKSEI